MTKPVRLQLSRKKGFNLQLESLIANGLEAVNVARPTVWGNPFRVGHPFGTFTAKVIDNRHAWNLYRSVAPDNEKLVTAARQHLQGKNLACWCKLPEPGFEDECHAAVLLALANPVCEEMR